MSLLRNYVFTYLRTPSTMKPMPPTDLQSLCELGQEQLMRMEYLSAEETLIRAEQMAFAQRDFDTLGRLYMPLQEARRQRRQRCGEGVVRLDLIAHDPTDPPDGAHVVDKYPHGQLLVAGWGSIEPALKVRALQRQHGLYVETFLAAAYPVGGALAIALVPSDSVQLPDPTPRSIDELIRALPPHAIAFHENELPKGDQKGTWQTFAKSEIWEWLNALVPGRAFT